MRSGRVWRHALIAIAVSGIAVLALVSQAVIGIDPWFSPRYLVPLAGMIFSAAMNTISLAGERAYAAQSTPAWRYTAVCVTYQANCPMQVGRD